MSDSENERIESPPADSPVAAADDDDDAIGSGDDLFGDGGDDDGEGQLSDQPLSDIELEEDDEERYGSGREDARAARQTKEEVLMDVDIFRHRTPKSTDGTLQSLRIPPFIKINPEEYRPDTFEPSAFDLDNSLAKNPHSVARFRRDPATGAVQSNAAIYRWSDGSVTLAVGDEHFEVLTKGLAPPEDKPYQELQDAHYYAAAAHLSSSLLLTVGHVTEQYSVRANRTVADDALKRLTDRLQAASQNSEHASANMIIRTVRDPELAKKEAELAEKERERARRRRETAAARLDGVPGGGRSSWGGALSVGDLEGTSGGGRRSGGSRKRGGPGGGARAKRRRDEYDSDDELPSGARRNDEYDKGDDFIAPSDDELSDEEGEEEEDDDDEEEEELLDDDDDEDDGGRAAAKSRRTKRQKTAEAEDEGDDDAPASRRNRRHIIDDDEE